MCQQSLLCVRDQEAEVQVQLLQAGSSLVLCERVKQPEGKSV